MIELRIDPAVQSRIDELAERANRGVLSDDERAAVRKGMEAARRGEFASDDEIAALYNHNRE